MVENTPATWEAYYCGVIFPIHFKPCSAHKTTRANIRPVNCVYASHTAVLICPCTHLF
jgi:hypothetical protein